MVLRSTNDPTPVLLRGGKAGPQSVQIVLVALVRFDAFGVVIIP